jgi:hypothetical protein
LWFICILLVRSCIVSQSCIHRNVRIRHGMNGMNGMKWLSEVKIAAKQGFKCGRVTMLYKSLLINKYFPVISKSVMHLKIHPIFKDRLRCFEKPYIARRISWKSSFWPRFWS